MTTRVDELHEIARALAPRALAVGDAIWAEPELRWEEHRAVARQIDLARSYGLDVEESLAGIPTAFSAGASGDGPVIAILGEFDALDGVSQRAGVAQAEPVNVGGPGHGCGHNLLGVGSLLAAAIAREYASRHGLIGRIRYVGCPAEEAASGKTVLVQRGVFDDVDAALTWHPADHLASGQYLTLAYTQLEIAFTGVAAHAGVAPELGRSALDALELCNVGINFLREHVPPDTRLHYAITDAGGRSANVVPASAAGVYVIRSADVDALVELRERVRRIAQGAALMTDTDVSVQVVGASAAMLPNAVLEAELGAVLEELGPIGFSEQDRAEAAPFTDAASVLADAPIPATGVWRQTGASTDVGDVSRVTPTVMLTATTEAIGTPVHSWQMVAQGVSGAAHRGTVHAAIALAETAIRLIERPELLAAARAEFVAATPLGYRSPLPDGFAPPGDRAE